jgi:hypothetical protein
LIAVVVAAAGGHALARAVVEDVFEQLEQHGWKISGLVRIIWRRVGYGQTKSIDRIVHWVEEATLGMIKFSSAASSS